MSKEAYTEDLEVEVLERRPHARWRRQPADVGSAGAERFRRKSVKTRVCGADIILASRAALRPEAARPGIKETSVMIQALHRHP